MHTISNALNIMHTTSNALACIRYPTHPLLTSWYGVGLRSTILAPVPLATMNVGNGAGDDEVRVLAVRIIPF